MKHYQINIGLTQNSPSTAQLRRPYKLIRQGVATPLGRFCVSPTLEPVMNYIAQAQPSRIAVCKAQGARFSY
ncbi:MAG: hypothetical protein V4568_15715, partial [Pseudomonadota bacterium]